MSPSPGVQDLRAGVWQEALGMRALLHHNECSVLKASFFGGSTKMEVLEGLGKAGLW